MGHNRNMGVEGGVENKSRHLKKVEELKFLNEKEFQRTTQQRQHCMNNIIVRLSFIITVFLCIINEYIFWSLQHSCHPFYKMPGPSTRVFAKADDSSRDWIMQINNAYIIFLKSLILLLTKNIGKERTLFFLFWIQLSLDAYTELT